MRTRLYGEDYGYSMQQGGWLGGFPDFSSVRGGSVAKSLAWLGPGIIVRTPAFDPPLPRMPIPVSVYGLLNERPSFCSSARAFQSPWIWLKAGSEGDLPPETAVPLPLKGCCGRIHLSIRGSRCHSIIGLPLWRLLLSYSLFPGRRLFS